MKNLITKFALLLLILHVFGVAKSQLEVENLMRGGIEDSEKLMEAYISPYAKSLGNNLAGGWYNTAKPHKLLGVDLSVSLSMTTVPDFDRTFSVSELDLKNLVAAQSDIAQTAAGAKEKTDMILQVDDPMNPGTKIDLTTFQFPAGTGVSTVPFPTAKLGVGFVKNTDLMLRYVPEITFQDAGKFKVFGFGIKHSLKQWIPVLKRMPMFHLSALAAYTKMDVSNGISLQPDPDVVYIEPGDYDNQRFSMGVTNFTAGIITSINLPVIAFYGGLGISKSNTSINLEGDYPLTTIEDEPNTHSSPGDKIVVALKEPISGMEINIDNGFTGTAGFRLKFAVLTIHADYTVGQYNMINTGIGFTFR